MRYRFITAMMMTTLLMNACYDEQTLIIHDFDVQVDDPNAEDSKEGEHNTTDDERDDDSAGGNGENGEDDDIYDPSGDACEPGDDCTGEEASCDVCVASSQKCDGTNLLVCEKDAQGCLTWQLQDNCADHGMWCDSATKSCMGCGAQCEVGTQKCTSTGIAECSLDGHGCADWHQVTNCGSDEHCDDVTKKCVSGCTSICTEGETRCAKNAIETCELADNGCMSWRLNETCDAGKVCIGNAPRCDYECGDECAPFSIIVLPDPQNYTASSAGIYKKQMEWIAEHKDEENIRFVLHLGDMTDNNSSTHYERAVAAHDVLAKAGIPCAPSTGNHDYKEGGTGITFKCRDRSQFPKYFNDAYFQTKYADSSWFHGYKLGANMYATFNVGEMKFGVIALEFFPRKEALCWAENLLSNELRDHYVIITTHGYLNVGATESATGSYSTGSNGDISSGAWGIEIYKELVARYNNIIMIVSGHESGAEHRSRDGYNGNSVYEMLVDYQSEKPCTSSSCQASSCGSTYNAGNGWMRMLKINPINEKNADGTLKENVHATTFSVLEEYQKSQKMFCSDLNSSSDRRLYDNKASKGDHNFTFALDFSQPREFKYSNGGNISFTGRTINSPSNDATDGDQFVPSIAVVRSTGAFVAAWEDDADKDGRHRVMARGFCAGGCDEYSAIDVSNSAGEQKNPDIAVDDKGNYVVVWEEKGSNGDLDIYMRGFDAKGVERFAQKQVNADSNGAQELPAIAMNKEGNFVVTWQDSSVNSKTPQVYMRGFNADGSELFTARNAMESIAGSRRKPDVGMAEDGSFVVTWEDDTDANGAYQIVAKGFNADGSVRLPVFTVNTKAEGQQLNPAIGMNESGTFYIAFEDDSDGNGKYLIIARGFDNNGAEIQKDVTLSGANEETKDPVVCVDRSGKAVFGWIAQANNAGDIQRRVLTSPGKLKSEEVVSRYTSGIQKSPAVGCSAKGSYVFLFADDNKSRGTMDIMGRGFNE